MLSRAVTSLLCRCFHRSWSFVAAPLFWLALEYRHVVLHCLVRLWYMYCVSFGGILDVFFQFFYGKADSDPEVRIGFYGPLYLAVTCLCFSLEKYRFADLSGR